MSNSLLGLIAAAQTLPTGAPPDALVTVPLIWPCPAGGGAAWALAAPNAVSARQPTMMWAVVQTLLAERFATMIAPPMNPFSRVTADPCREPPRWAGPKHR